MKRTKLPSRPKLVKELDKEFSLQIRARDMKLYDGMCPFCGRQPIECCFHFVRKSRSTYLRWDKRNAVGSCFRCNFSMEHAEGPFWAWYVRKYGQEGMETLLAASHLPAKWGRTELHASLLWMRAGNGSSLGSTCDPATPKDTPREAGEGGVTP